MILKLDFTSDVPIYLQIRNQVVLGIAEGRLAPGEKLPPIRTLAEECGVNMMTVNKSYAQLKQEGYIVADRRSGAAVSPNVGREGLSAAARDTMRLTAAEAKLGGMSRERWLAMCAEAFDTDGGHKND